MAEVFATRVSTLRKCPHHLRGRLIALSERLRAKWENDVDGEIRAWKLFVLIPSMLLHRPRGAGSVGRSELAQWFEDYQQGRWDQIAGKGENSLQHYSLVHKFISMPQAMKIPAAKAAVDKEWEKLEKISAWNLTKVKSKKQVIDEART